MEPWHLQARISFSSPSSSWHIRQYDSIDVDKLLCVRFVASEHSLRFRLPPRDSLGGGDATSDSRRINLKDEKENEILTLQNTLHLATLNKIREYSAVHNSVYDFQVSTKKDHAYFLLPWEFLGKIDFISCQVRWTFLGASQHAKKNVLTSHV